MIPPRWGDHELYIYLTSTLVVGDLQRPSREALPHITEEDPTDVTSESVTSGPPVKLRRGNSASVESMTSSYSRTSKAQGWKGCDSVMGWVGGWVVDVGLLIFWECDSGCMADNPWDLTAE